MLRECRLDLKWTDIDAADFDHVIASTTVGVTAVFVSNVLVAALGPGALEGFPCLLPTTPVQQSRTRPLNVEIPEFPVGHGGTVFVAQFNRIARHRPACRPVAHALGSVGEKNMQHLSRPDTVQDIDGKVTLEALAQFSRKRLAGGRHQTKGDCVPRRQPFAGQDGRKTGRRSEEDRRPETADLPAPALKNSLRRGALPHQEGGRADAEGKSQRVAKTIGEEEFGGRKTDVPLGELQNISAIELRRPEEVGMGMDCAFGPSS